MLRNYFVPKRFLFLILFTLSFLFSDNGYALNFDGDDDYVTTPISRNIDLLDLTIEGWFKFEGDINGSYHAIFGGESSNFYIGKNGGDGNLFIQDNKDWFIKILIVSSLIT